MYAYRIAENILNTHGPEIARYRVSARLKRWKASLNLDTLSPIHSSVCTMRPEAIAYRYARVMLWQSVRNSLENAIASLDYARHLRRDS